MSDEKKKMKKKPKKSRKRKKIVQEKRKLELEDGRVVEGQIVIDPETRKIEKMVVRVREPDQETVPDGINFHKVAEKKKGHKKTFHAHVGGKKVRLKGRPSRKIFDDFMKDPDGKLGELIEERSEEKPKSSRDSRKSKKNHKES